MGLARAAGGKWDREKMPSEAPLRERGSFSDEPSDAGFRTGTLDQAADQPWQHDLEFTIKPVRRIAND